MKILIIHTNAGAGHLRAAEAVCKAGLKYFPEAEFKIMDSLEYTTAWMKKIYPVTYVVLVKYLSLVWRFFYFYCNIKCLEKFNCRLRQRILVTQQGRFFKMIQEEAPDLVLTTHYLPSDYLSFMKRKGKLKTFVAVCLTDYEPHLMWKNPELDQYFIASEEMLPEMKRLRFPLEKVKVSGIPIHQEFAIVEDQMMMRKKLGLKLNEFTLMITSGGFGLGPVKAVVRELKKVTKPIQILVICGHNADLKSQVEKEIEGSIHDFRLFEFVKNIHELMSASDLLISKPGGLTTTEVMAKGLPMIVYQPIAGHETANCQMLLKHQAAIEMKKISELPQVVMELLDHPEKLQGLKENMKALGHPEAATEIVFELKKIMEMRQKDGNESADPKIK